MVSKAAVSKFAAIFGPKHVVYNIHIFSHLFAFLKHFGTLDTFSCFPFESHLGQLKRLIHGPQDPAVQLFRRISELDSLDVLETSCPLDDVGVPLKNVHTPRQILTQRNLLLQATTRQCSFDRWSTGCVSNHRS